MPVAGGGFEQCYNAQAAVAAEVTQAANDKQQLKSMLDELGALPEDLGKPDALLADNGYYSAANVEACAAANIEPLIAEGREKHHPSLDERFGAAPPEPENPTPVEAMSHRLGDTPREEALRVAQAARRTGVRHHQIGARIPPIQPARARVCPRRVESRDHRLEPEANVQPGIRRLRQGAG
jgi:hypothetical protein